MHETKIFFSMKTFSHPFITTSLFILVFLIASSCENNIESDELTPSATLKVEDSIQSSEENLYNYDQELRIQNRSTIQITDNGWSDNTLSSDCVNGLCDDVWELTLTQKYSVTITVEDCCCPGDYFEVYVNSELLFTTPNLSPPWGCGYSGENSSGSFTKIFCPGTYTIVVRDAGFDGHSHEEIDARNMCPAGFTVSGSLTPITDVLPSINMTITNNDRKAGPVVQDTFVVNHLLAMLRAVEPYVVSNHLGLQELNTTVFRESILTNEEIEFAQKIIAINNRIIEGALKGEEVVIEEKEFEFVEPLFIYFAEISNEQCGTRNNPDTCPDRIDSGQFFCTEQDVVDHLLSLGYHKTAGYACGFNCPYDYTLVIDHPCGNNGPYRNQGIIDLLENELWTYSAQSPEPNPELHSYTWPYFSWPGYVNWWHRVYC